jgi:hypothetical protein
MSNPENTFPKVGLDIMRIAQPQIDLQDRQEPQTFRGHRLAIDGCTGSYTVEEHEQVTSALCNDLIIDAQSAGVLNVDLIVEAYGANAERTIMESAGFAWCGTISQGTPTQKTYAVFRRCTRQTGSVDGNLAVAPPTLAPSHEERRAVEALKEKYSQPLSESRLMELDAMGKQPEPIPARDLIADKLRAEIAAMEAQS